LPDFKKVILRIWASILDDMSCNIRFIWMVQTAITNKLQRFLWNHQIHLAYSNKGKLKDSLGNPNDKTEMLQKSGIYQEECEACDSLYILVRKNVA
jgi:hypothetical protein